MEQADPYVLSCEGLTPPAEAGGAERRVLDKTLILSYNRSYWTSIIRLRGKGLWCVPTEFTPAEGFLGCIDRLRNNNIAIARGELR